MCRKISRQGGSIMICHTLMCPIYRRNCCTVHVTLFFVAIIHCVIEAIHILANVQLTKENILERRVNCIELGLKSTPAIVHVCFQVSCHTEGIFGKVPKGGEGVILDLKINIANSIYTCNCACTLSSHADHQ